MSTIWDNHWDDLKNNRTKYTKNYTHVSPENMIDNTDTIFIRTYINTQKKRAWFGKVSNFESNPRETYFTVRLIKEIELPQTVANYSSGWYLFNGSLDLVEKNRSEPPTLINQQNAQTNLLEPPFFSILKTTTDYREFENYTATLLRSIGLNEVYTNPPQRQAGLPDGFFKIRNIEVIYDAKLNQNYLNDCDQQINNYCNQLCEGSVIFGDIVIKLNPDNDKFVWIITRGETGYIKTMNNVTVKEVNISTLAKLYNLRLNQGMHQNELENSLRNIERI